jgi:hypothetical protein
MPRKYTKKKTKVKRGGTLTKTFEPEPEPEQYDIQEPELQPFDELPEQSEFFSKLDSQIPEKIDGPMTYDEFVQYLQNKNLYGCFNLIRSKYLSRDITTQIDVDSHLMKSNDCINRFEDNGDQIQVSMSRWFEKNRWFEYPNPNYYGYNFIHIDDLDILLKGLGISAEATRLSKEYHKKLPEYREENLREAYQYYIKDYEGISRQYEQNSAINQKSFAQTLAQKSKGLIEPQLHKLLYKYPFDTYLTQTWTDMWEDVLMDPYIEFIIDKMYQGKEVDDITKQNMISTIKKMLEDSKSDFFISKIPPFDMNTYLELLKLHQ